MLLPKGSEFKAWLEKWVALLRKHAKKSIEQFIEEIEAKIEEKEWGPINKSDIGISQTDSLWTYRPLTLFCNWYVH